MVNLWRCSPVFAALLMVACAPAESTGPSKISGLKTPESVVAAADGRVFVSEINGFDKNGDGQISVISPNGKLSVFATGMDDPKGLAMIADDLYVADKTRVLKVAPDGSWTVFADTLDFPRTPQFLNDLEPDPQGNLYVSDSGDLSKGGAIYKINPAGEVSLIIDAERDARILAPNGLLMDDTGTVMLQVDFATGVLYRLDINTGDMVDIAEGFGGGDGLVHTATGDMYVSDWKNGKVFKVDTAGEVHLIKDGFQASADIALSADGKHLLVPDMKAGELIWLPI
ncbi:gluconolaconase [Pseudomethylobacillus aquaticus]|uniref:Gluconolaconase n=1 Tax=Pseudomethylobacillus aquaticus TaxID=2676064 RepID=A0A3N0V6L4_9PROT|nr:gluconolaconase [Pseudomethylobacillus aquaticus]